MQPAWRSRFRKTRLQSTLDPLVPTFQLHVTIASSYAPQNLFCRAVNPRDGRRDAPKAKRTDARRKSRLAESSAAQFLYDFPTCRTQILSRGFAAIMRLDNRGSTDVVRKLAPAFFVPSHREMDHHVHVLEGLIATKSQCLLITLNRDPQFRPHILGLVKDHLCTALGVNAILQTNARNGLSISIVSEPISKSTKLQYAHTVSLRCLQLEPAHTGTYDSAIKL